MSQHQLPCLPQSRAGSFSSTRILVPQTQDPQHEIQEDHEYKSDIDPSTTQAHISVHLSPQIAEVPLPPELQPLKFTVPIDRGPQVRASTRIHPRITPSINPELAHIMSSGLSAYVFRTSATMPIPTTINSGNRTSHTILTLHTP